MNALEFKNITKIYKGNPLFDGFSLSVEQNSILSIIGPSGSGKTTLLRLASMLEHLDGGEIVIDGADVIDKDSEPEKFPAKQKIGIVFQLFNLFPHLSALENVALSPMAVQKIGKKEALDRAKYLLDLVGLGDKLSFYSKELSGGQKQRVAIARALATNPKILLLDEITSSLDPELTLEVLSVVKKIAQKKELTILSVTHNMRFAKEISDRVCFLEGARILEDSGAEEFFVHQQNPRVVQFLKDFT